MDIIKEESCLLLMDGEVQIGELDFVRDEGRMRIDYVGVSPAHRGQGLAKRLVDAAVALAREEEMKIVPVCPYAKAVLVRDKSAADVLL